jgi:hypothetical protein
VSLRAANRARRLSWIRPFQRTRKAIDRSVRLIESSCRVIEAAERFAARRPARAARQYERAAGWLDQAGMQLLCAVRSLSVTADKVALSPAHARGAPSMLFGQTFRWVGAARKLAILTNRLDDTSNLILDAVAAGSTLDFSSLLPDPEIAAPRVIRLRPLPPRRLSAGSGTIRVTHSRRPRSVRVPVTEAVRRIIRGRAPPLVSTCCCSF